MLAFHGGIGIEDLHLQAPGTVFALPRFGPRVVDTTEFAWPAIGESIKHQAYDELVVTGQFISGNGDTGAVADYSARFNVHVVGEFHAMAGSETHLFTEQYWPSCDSLAQLHERAAMAPVTQPSEVKKKQTERPKSMALRFKSANTNLVVVPNPADNRIVVTGLERDWDMTIFDDRGRGCFTTRPVADKCVIDLTQLLPGQYVLQQAVPAGIRTAQFQIIR